METHGGAAAKPNDSTTSTSQSVACLSIGQSYSFLQQNTQEHLQEIVFTTAGHLTLTTSQKPHLGSAPHHPQKVFCSLEKLSADRRLTVAVCHLSIYGGP